MPIMSLKIEDDRFIVKEKQFSIRYVTFAFFKFKDCSSLKQFLGTR